MLDRQQAKVIQKKMNAANTTPMYVSPLVSAFCNELVPNAEPTYVNVRPTAGAQPNYCFVNVPAQIKTGDGELVHGWTIWLWPKVVLSAEFHGCWRDPATGELVDITPKTERRILFLFDPTRTFQGTRVPNVYKPLHTDLVVKEWIVAQIKTGSMICVGPQIITQALIEAQIRGISLTGRLLKLE